MIFEVFKREITSFYIFRPSYFPDITDLLYGMKCDDLVNVFGESKIGLHEFLTIDEEKLKEVGVKYSFKRQLILQGLLK